MTRTARANRGFVSKALVISIPLALVDLASVGVHADPVVNCSALSDSRGQAQCRLMQGYLRDESDHRKPFPGCLAIRTIDQECQRNSLGDSWTCAERPTISLSLQQSFMLPRCLVWDGAAESYCKAEYGRGAHASGFCSIELQTPAGHMVPSIACLPQDAARVDDAPPRVPAGLEGADHFVLPKDAFRPPECLAVRLRAHECLRATFIDNWTCDARPPLNEFTAECFVFLAHKLGVRPPLAATDGPPRGAADQATIDLEIVDDWVGGSVVGPVPCKPSP